MRIDSNRDAIAIYSQRHHLSIFYKSLCINRLKNPHFSRIFAPWEADGKKTREKRPFLKVFHQSFPARRSQGVTAPAACRREPLVIVSPRRQGKKITSNACTCGIFSLILQTQTNFQFFIWTIITRKTTNASVRIKLGELIPTKVLFTEISYNENILEH